MSDKPVTIALRELGLQLHQALNDISHNPTDQREVDAFRRARAIADMLREEDVRTD